MNPGRPSVYVSLSALRDLARRALPYSVRVGVARLRGLPALLAAAPGFARRRGAAEALDALPFVLAEHASPLLRPGTTAEPALQRAKERNVALAAARLDRLIVAPGEVFSFHWAVGWPSPLFGFRAGLELHDGRPARGAGGGACQSSNLLYLLALRAGMRIVERHRHALDLFPDNDRTVPFGCGATVAYNHADLRFENPLPQPVALRLELAGGELRGRLLAPADPGFRVEVYEVDHRFVREGDAWFRENRIRRRFVAPDGTVLLDQEVAHNRGRVLYDHQGLLACGAPR